MLDRLVVSLRQFFTGLFFHPDQEDFGTPAAEGLDFEEVLFNSDGNQLHGFLLKAKTPARGLVLHCHGNAGNITVHHPLLTFLVKAGYDVLAFDYAGYGRSTGRPSLSGIEDDARAAIAFLLKRNDLRTDRLAIFGQSLGGAAAAAAAVHPSVRCLVLEATFTTYRHIAWSSFVGRLLFFLVSAVIPDGGPALHLPAFKPRPVLLVHGEDDTVVPPRFSRKLHSLFPDHTKIHIVPLVGHLTPAADQSSPFREEILSFLEKHLAES